MKKFLLSAFVITAFIVYVIYQKIGGTREVKIAESTSAPTSSTQVVSIDNQTPAVSTLPETAQSAPQAVSGSGLKDGEYTGDVADAYYGNVQVKAVVSGGRITDVQFLQYPNDRRTSIEINTQAMPDLKQEAIQAQNAQVDMVSGATQTSLAFKESLQSALDKAR